MKTCDFDNVFNTSRSDDVKSHHSHVLKRSHSPIRSKKIFEVSKVSKAKLQVSRAPLFNDAFCGKIYMNRRKLKEIEKRPENILAAKSNIRKYRFILKQMKDKNASYIEKQPIYGHIGANLGQLRKL